MGDGAPLASMSPDRFSVRFISNQEMDAGTYLMRIAADDGVRAYVDDTRVIDEWHLSNGSETYTTEVSLDAGVHVITLEYYENTESAFIEYSLDPIAPVTPVDNADVSGSGTTATVIASVLNVRSEPNVFAPILTKVNRGDTYPILGQNTTGTWIQLNIDGLIGWVNETYTDEFNYVNVPIIDETVIDVPDLSGYTLTTTANLNMRTGPGLEYDVIRIIPENTLVDIEGRTIDSDWWQVSYRGNVGWVTEAFVNLSNSVNINDVFIVD